MIKLHSRIKSKIKKLLGRDLLQSIEASQKETNRKIVALVEENKGLLEGTFAKIFDVEKNLQNISFLMDEKEILPNDYYQYMNSHSLKDDYLDLIRGLDEESVLNVQKALARIQQLKNTGNEFYSLSIDEMNELKNFRSNFENAIVRLDYNTWAYKDYLLPVPFFDASVFYLKHNLDYFKTIDYTKCVIDAGASVGDSAVFLSRKFMKSGVYSFEPTSELFAILNKSIELNNITNVYPQKMGLLDTECDREIFFAGYFGQSTSINKYRNNGQNAEMVHFTTIDNFVKKNNLQVGLIKADVEGAERFLLKGAIETIKSQRPALNISIYHSAEDFFKIKPMIESLNLGYKFKISKPALTNIVVETTLLAEVE